MKTEHEFNAYLKSQFKKFSEYKAVKFADKFKLGMPDWIVFHEGRAAAVECKFIHTTKKKGKLLRHSVSPSQISFLKRFNTVKVNSWVLIGAKEEKCMYLGLWCEVTPEGNVTKEILEDRFVEIPFSNIETLLQLFFKLPY